MSWFLKKRRRRDLLMTTSPGEDAVPTFTDSQLLSPIFFYDGINKTSYAAGNFQADHNRV